MHGQLLRFVRAGDARILGEQNANLPQVAKILVQALGKGDKLITIPDIPVAAGVLKQMQGAIGAETFQSLVAALKPKQQAVLQEALSNQ